MIRKFINISLIASMMIFSSGCAITDSKSVDKTEFTSNVKNGKLFNRDIQKRYEKISEERRKRQDKKYYNKFVINTDEGDLNGLENVKIKMKTINMKSSDVLNIVSETLGCGLIIEPDNTLTAEPNSLEKVLTFNIDTNVHNILTTIEKYGDLDIVYKNKIIYVFKKMKIHGSFENLNTDKSPIYTNVKEHLTTLLGDKAKIVIDSFSGSFSITASPSIIRENKNFIETIVSESNSNALLNLNIYKIDNNVLSENGLNRELFLGDMMNIARGGEIKNSPILDVLFQKNNISEVKGKKIGMNLGLQLLEQEGIIHNVSTLKMNLTNGVQSELKSLKERGKWVRGDVQQNNSRMNGISETNYTEGKPTFESEKVGISLSVLPKVNTNTKNLTMSIKYSESSVYGLEKTTWNRTKDSSIVLDKNLIQENIIDTNVVLSSMDEYKVISGLKDEKYQNDGSYNTIVDELGTNKKEVMYKDTFMIAKVEFPDEAKINIINKMLDLELIKDTNNLKSLEVKEKPRNIKYDNIDFEQYKTDVIIPNINKQDSHMTNDVNKEERDLKKALEIIKSEEKSNNTTNNVEDNNNTKKIKSLMENVDDKQVITKEVITKEVATKEVITNSVATNSVVTKEENVSNNNEVKNVETPMTDEEKAKFSKLLESEVKKVFTKSPRQTEYQDKVKSKKEKKLVEKNTNINNGVNDINNTNLTPLSK